MGHNGEVPRESDWIGFLAVKSVKKCVFIPQCNSTSLEQRGAAMDWPASAELATRSTVRFTLGVDVCANSQFFFYLLGWPSFHF